MQLRRLRSHRLSLLAAGMLLASPLAAGCGFDYATDRVNTVSAGVSDRSGEVDVLGAVVIAGQDDVGLFVATLVNKDAEPIDLEGVRQTEEIQPIGDEQPTTIESGANVSLFQTGGLPISGSFVAGDFVPVTLTFSNGQVTTVEVNVLPPCHQYSLDKLTGLTLPEAPGEAPAEGPETDPEADVPEAEVPEAEGEAETEGDAATDRYSCDTLPAVEHGGEEGEGGEEGGEGEGAEPSENGTAGVEGTE